MESKLLSEKDLACYLNQSPWTVRRWRCDHGLPHLKIASRIFYQLEDVKTWLDSRKK